MLVDSDGTVTDRTARQRVSTATFTRRARPGCADRRRFDAPTARPSTVDRPPDRPTRRRPAALTVRRSTPGANAQQRGVERQAGTEREQQHGPRGGSGRRRISSSTMSTVGDEQLPCSASTARDSSSAPGGRSQFALRSHRGCAAHPDVRPTRRRRSGPARAAPSRSSTSSATWTASTSGTRADRPIRKPEIGDVPGHVVGRRDVGHGGDLDDLVARVPARAAPPRRPRASANSACATICSASAVGGCTCRLVSSHAEQHGRAAGRRARSRDTTPRPGQRRIAAHVTDEQPLRRRRHAEVPGEQDVQARGDVAGAGADREQADVGRRPSAAAASASADGGLAQRHRLGRGSAACAAPVDQPD